MFVQLRRRATALRHLDAGTCALHLFETIQLQPTQGSLYRQRGVSLHTVTMPKLNTTCFRLFKLGIEPHATHMWRKNHNLVCSPARGTGGPGPTASALAPQPTASRAEQHIRLPCTQESAHIDRKPIRQRSLVRVGASLKSNMLFNHPGQHRSDSLLAANLHSTD